MIRFNEGSEIITNTDDALKNPSNNKGLEEQIQKYTENATRNIKFNVIIKPAIISLIALMVSFLIDVSSVPFLGNISTDIAQKLFPSWQPSIQNFLPFTFWWLPLTVYLMFIGLSYLAYKKLTIEVIRTPTSETIDRIITSNLSIIDGISTALPLIGAAILLLSIQMGEEIFLGLSVPFEIKALIVLALGKLFEPVFDQIGLEFQHIVSHVRSINDNYLSKIQSETSQKLIDKIEKNNFSNNVGISNKDLENYGEVLIQLSKLSEIILNNNNSIISVMEKMNDMKYITNEKVEQLKNISEAIAHAARSFNDEKTLTGLKYLESIVTKR